MSKKPPTHQKIDLSRFTARFGCGFIFGLFAALGTGLLFGAQTMAGLFWGWILFSLLFGLLSVIFGDKFWTTIIRWF